MRYEMWAYVLRSTHGVLIQQKKRFDDDV